MRARSTVTRVGVVGWAAVLLLAGQTGASVADAPSSPPPHVRPGCVLCHSDQSIEEHSPPGLDLYVPADALKGSAHESLACPSCHPEPSSVIHAGPAVQRRGAWASCMGCHPEAAEQYLAGTHVGPALAGVQQLAGGPPIRGESEWPGGATSLGKRCVLCHGMHQVTLLSAGFVRASRSREPAPPFGVAFGVAGAGAALVVGLLLWRRRRAPGADRAAPTNQS